MNWWTEIVIIWLYFRYFWEWECLCFWEVSGQNIEREYKDIDDERVPVYFGFEHSSFWKAVQERADLEVLWY